VNFDNYIELFKSTEVENKNLELKNSNKLNKNGKLYIDDLLSIIVGFANIDGGYLIIGVNDDGSPEGKGIFDQYSTDTKSGIDKVKEFINNKCLDKISPIINIDLKFFSEGEYEFLSIVIPKKNSIPHAVVTKRGDKVYHRDYYVKNSHSCSLVSDSQLEWLFDSNNYNLEDKLFTIQATTYKLLAGIPHSIGIGKIGDWVILQPDVVKEAQQFIHAIYNDLEKDIQNGLDFRIELFSEIILYNIIQTIDGYGSRVIGENAKTIPYPPESFILGKISQTKKEELFDIFTNKIHYPNNTEVEFKKENIRSVFCIFRNEYCNVKVSLTNLGCGAGIPGCNPYGFVMLEKHGIDFQNAMHENYESYTFVVNVEIERKFPEVFDQTYYDTIEFCEKLNNSIMKYWDINHFLKEYPHYRKLYSVEYKIDQLYKMLKE
jgi:hypothetical protein